jgi:uncharacterized protein (DUF697 family)
MNMIEKAERTVSIAVAAATATGAIPIPFADAPLLIGEQVAMMAAIAKIFNIDIKTDGLKALATAALGVGGATLIGKTVVAGIFKLIPGPGWLIGGAISGATAGAITYGVGHAFIEVCKGIKIGKIEENDVTSKSSIAAFLKYFKDFSKAWKKNPFKSQSDYYDGDNDDYQGDEDSEDNDPDDGGEY